MSLSILVGMMEIVFAKGSGEPDELKGSRPVRGGAVGKAGHAARWPSTLRIP